MNDLTPSARPSLPALPYGELVVPLLVAQEGERAAKRYVEFFAANIRNPNTRRAYARAATDFLGWCEQRGLALATIEPVHVAAYVELLLQTGLPRQPDEPPAPLAPPSVKQQLAAVRMLFDWFVVGQVVPHNPASSVRGPKHVVSRGKTPVLPREDAKALIDAIETDTLIGLRDRALIGTLLYTFARIEAALGLDVGDYFPAGRKRWRVRRLCCVFCILARRAPGFGMARQRLVQLRADLAFKGRQFTAEVILWAVRWYLMFPVSYRDLELMLQDRGVEVAHTTIFRWIQAYAPALEKRIRPHLRRSNGSWRVDETYVRVKGRWCYLYRAVDSRGQTIDFLLATRRDAAAAKRFFRKALRQPHTANPRTISVDKNPAYPRAVAEMKADGALWRFSRLRQSKYLNNIVEQDHRRVKRLVRPGLGFGSLRTARRTLAGYEAMAMIRKGQAHQVGGRDMRAQAAFVAKLFGLAA